MNENTTTTTAKVVARPKTKYQFFVDPAKIPTIRRIVDKHLPEPKERTLKDVLTFNSDHPYPGLVGFKLPGAYEARRGMARELYRKGGHFGLFEELRDGGIKAIEVKNYFSGK